jgi:HK97 family phage major capsid protein
MPFAPHLVEKVDIVMKFLTQGNFSKLDGRLVLSFSCSRSETIGNPYNTLFGLPVIAIEQAATLGTVGDIILADLAGGYILAEKGGIQADMSIHVRYLWDEACFRFIMRVDGMPVLASSITPYKGALALSNFVVLETRS